MSADSGQGRVGWLAVPATAYFILIYGLPLAFLLVRSVIGPEGFTLAPFHELFADAFSWRVIGNTLRTAALVTLLCLALGYPVAFVLARARPAFQIVLLVAIVLPLSVGVVVKAFAWQILLRRDGMISNLLQATGIVEEPLRLLFTETGLVLGAVNVFLPFMILPVYSVVRLVDPRLAEAAATLGASPVYRFLRITVPLTLPGVIAGIAFVFSLAISMYVIPTLLIGDRFQTLATLTGRSFLTLRNEQLASSSAVVLLILAVAVVVLSGFLQRLVTPSR